MVSRKRSPNYPSVDLGKAVERTKQLYKTVERGEFTQLDAASSWGYKSVNGISRGVVGALRQYGIIEQPKGDNGKLTQRGLTIALRVESSPEYQRSIREAAMEPPLFGDLFQSGKANSARDALQQHLVVEKGFTNDGAARLIEVLSATKTFANIGDEQGTPRLFDGLTTDLPNPEPRVDSSDSLNEMADLANQREASLQTAPESLRSSDRTRIPLRLVDGFDAAIELPSEMTEAAWKHMLRYLEVMKDAYVRVSEEVPATAVDDTLNDSNSEIQSPMIEEIE